MQASIVLVLGQLGMRNMQKALLNALLIPFDDLKKMQSEGDFTKIMALQEELKLYHWVMYGTIFVKLLKYLKV